MTGRVLWTLLVPVLIASRTVPARGAVSDDELIRRGKQVAEYYLQKTSDFEGVEHFGGPFRLEDSDIKVRSAIPNQILDLLVTPHAGAHGAPHFPILKISAAVRQQWGNRTNSSAQPLFGEFQVHGKLSSTEVDFFLKSVADLQTMAPVVHQVTLLSETNLQREVRTLIPIDKIEAVSESEVIVYGGHNLDYEFHDNLPLPRHIQNQPKGERFPKTLVVRTNVSDQQLIQIAKTRVGPDLLHDWSYVRLIGSSLEIHDGKFIRARPAGAYVFRKENAVWHFDIAFHISADSGDFGRRERCVLMPKPPAATLRTIIQKGFSVLSDQTYQPVATLLQNHKLNEEEIFNSLELFLRISGISHNIIRIERKEDEVTIISGNPTRGFGDSVILRRIKNNWVIISFGHWVS